MIPRRGRALTWPIGLAALVGAWLAHFFEFVRVSGWHAAVAQMASSTHVYFFPAGLALLGAAAAAGHGFRRAWAHLGQRLVRARRSLWAQPAATHPSPLDRRSRPERGAVRTWLVLTLLQSAIWVVQENLEAVAAGRPAPLAGVVGGAHLLLPVVEAEIALVLTAVLILLATLIRRRERLLRTVETLVARRWERARDCPDRWRRRTARSWSPLQIWGASLWQRPPPETGLSPSICG